MTGIEASLQTKSDDGPPPRHVAIIMDGNGRWAAARSLPRIEGHRQGAASVRRCVEAAIGLGIDYLTLFGFSSENWRRPETEISGLMGLLRLYLKNEVRELDENGVRLSFIGDRTRLASDIVTMIDDAEAETAANTRLVLTIALSYGARDEIAAATRRIAQAVAAGELDINDIDPSIVSRHLFTADMPDPDLLIRTSGEKRLSNFLLWQAAYTEFVFVDTLWPDFSADDLAAAIADFRRRERRFGATGS